jgi:2',3'-cyclic-nucleotide 2'-phosphodiesterase (5'-nucleotidase family)
VRAGHPGALLVDAGDAISAGNLGVRAGGEPILGLMNALGYDAMTIGNRESHPRREIFPQKVRGAAFPLLCANLTSRRGAPVPTRPSTIVVHEGVRVALFGVTVPMFTRKMWSQALCDYLFEDPVATARDLVPKLREEADLVVGLTHIGLQQDRLLAASVPGIDLIVGGHTHADLEAPEIVNDVPILHTTAYAFYVGCARLEWERGRATLMEWQRMPLRGR